MNVLERLEAITKSNDEWGFDFSVNTFQESGEPKYLSKVYFLGKVWDDCITDDLETLEEWVKDMEMYERVSSAESKIIKMYRSDDYDDLDHAAGDGAVYNVEVANSTPEGDIREILRVAGECHGGVVFDFVEFTHKDMVVSV